MLLRSFFFNTFECGLLPQRQNGSFFHFRIPLADPLFVSLGLAAYHRSVSDSDVLLHSNPTALKFNGWNLESRNWKENSSSKPPFLGCHVNFPGCKCCFNLQPVILGDRWWIPTYPAKFLGKPIWRREGSHLKLEFFSSFSLPTKKGHIGFRHEKTAYSWLGFLKPSRESYDFVRHVSSIDGALTVFCFELWMKQIMKWKVASAATAHTYWWAVVRDMWQGCLDRCETVDTAERPQLLFNT